MNRKPTRACRASDSFDVSVELVIQRERNPNDDHRGDKMTPVGSIRSTTRSSLAGAFKQVGVGGVKPNDDVATKGFW